MTPSEVFCMLLHWSPKHCSFPFYSQLPTITMKNAARWQWSPQWGRHTESHLPAYIKFLFVLSLTLVFLLLELSRELQSLGKQLFCRNSYINKSLRVAIVTTSSSNFIKCLQKNPGDTVHLSIKQTDAGGERSCPHSRTAETSCKIMLMWEEGRNKTLRSSLGTC